MGYPFLLACDVEYIKIIQPGTQPKLDGVQYVDSKQSCEEDDKGRGPVQQPLLRKRSGYHKVFPCTTHLDTTSQSRAFNGLQGFRYI